MITFKRRFHQDLIINPEINALRCNIWAGMGVGKTVETLTTLEGLFMPGAPSGKPQRADQVCALGFTVVVLDSKGLEGII